MKDINNSVRDEIINIKKNNKTNIDELEKILELKNVEIYDKNEIITNLENILEERKITINNIMKENMDKLQN